MEILSDSVLNKAAIHKVNVMRNVDEKLEVPTDWLYCFFNKHISPEHLNYKYITRINVIIQF